MTAGVLFQVGGLCNGSTAAFGAACRGSNPCPPAKILRSKILTLREGEKGYFFDRTEGPNSAKQDFDPAKAGVPRRSRGEGAK